MKYTILLFVALLAVTSASNFYSKCTCADDYFVFEQHDYRQCLSETEDHGIANCKEYGWSSTKGIYCRSCTDAYVVDTAGQCIAHELPNCVRASIALTNSVFPTYTAGFRCLECAAGHYIDGSDWCQPFPSTIGNCTVYRGTGTANNTICTECASGFYVKESTNDQCDPTPAVFNATAGETDTGYIENCEEYSNTNGSVGGWKCDKCASGFYRKESTEDLCEAAPAVFNATAGETDTGYIANCQDYINGNGTPGGWTCDNCTSGFYKKVSTPDACDAAPAVFNATAGETDTGYIENCQDYINGNGTPGGWKCDNCTSGFYKKLSTNDSCDATPAAFGAGETDTGYIANCDVYENTNGSVGGWKCAECADGFIPETAKDKCWETPTATTEPTTWTENCKTWTHPLTKYVCTACAGEFRIKTGTNNECVAVQRSVPNCEHYADDENWECDRCPERMWLEDNTCHECQAEMYEAPAGCTPGAPGTPGSPSTNGTDPTNSNGIVLSFGLILLVVLALF